ncbi:MAG TPA: WYL domain-containing protein [Synergistaceae bacterium]|nr:WYL domain-containing protein [Synergistaceae bacterium]
MPRDLSSVRLARLNMLLQLLASTACLSRERLFEQLEYTNPRTLERDIAYLREEFGATIHWDYQHRGYILENSGSFMLHLHLSENEATALVAGLGMAAHFLPHLEGDCNSLWQKIETALPENLASQARKLAQSAVMALPVSSLDPEIFSRILSALGHKRTIEARYTKPYTHHPKPERYHLSPWGVYFAGHAWYLWAWSHTSTPEGERAFRISRFDSVGVTDEGAREIPEGRNLTTYAEGAWYAFSGGKRRKVLLKVYPPMSRVVAETKWHVSQQIEECPDGGSIYLSAEVPHLEEVAKWVLASAPYAEVLEPAELRQRVAELAEGVKRRHGGKQR